jgi:serine/threonine protein kinase
MRNRVGAGRFGSSSSGSGGCDTQAHIPHLGGVAREAEGSVQIAHMSWRQSWDAPDPRLRFLAVEPEGPSFGAMNSCAHCGAPFTPVVSGQTLCDRCQGLMQPDPSSPLQQAEVAGFRLIHELGAGRFSHSWLGEDYRSHAVVVKLLRRYAPDADAVQRFVAEAERLATSANLDHPNLARPLSAGVHLVQALFLVYQGGGELTAADELRQRGRVLPSRALELCAQICEGLAALHREGVLHLDLKPANVGLTRLSDGTEQAVILDGATSHLLAHIGLLDGGELPLSTAAYTAPEQAEGRAAGPQSDLYSAGVLLYQLISGRLPMTGASSAELLRAHREHAVLSLKDIGRRVHPELEDVIARLMARDPARRPESGDEAALMLRSLAALADAAPVEDALESGEDPLAIPPRPPVASAPPQMLPPAVDPGLERAMLGQLPPARASPLRTWTRVLRRWRRQAMAAVALVAALASVLSFRGRHAGVPAVAAAPAVAPTPVRVAVSEALEKAARSPDTLLAAAPVEEPPRPNKLAQNAASPWAKNFERAQKALWTNRPAGAETILRDILKKPALSRRDRARASRMMGDAAAKRGSRAKATEWWRKSFQLYDDPEERAKVARLIQGSR